MIYTGQTTGTKLEKIKKLGLGIMISSNPNTFPSKDVADVPCALDNGAFTCYQKGYPFQEDIFLETLKRCYKLNIKLDFVVCPDIIAGGKESLLFSVEWAKRLRTAPNLALVLQDGIEANDLDRHKLKYFSRLFIGGTVSWKWQTVKQWVGFARENNMPIHIGQCGQLQYLRKAKELGVDSVDSTSFTVNNSFHIVEEFLTEKQQLLFKAC